MAVVIPSFVIFFTPNVGQQVRGERVNVGTIDGRPITLTEYNQALLEVRLGYRLRFGQWPDASMGAGMKEALERETLQHVLQVRRMNELGIRVGEDALVEQVRASFRNEQGQFDPALYDGQLKRLAQEGVSEDDFLSFVRHMVGIEHMNALFGLSGRLVPPRAAEDEYRRDNEQLVTQAVFFYASNFLDKVQIKTNDVAQYYTNQLARYRIPRRAQVHYVAFEAINYLGDAAKELAKITNLTEQIEQIYIRRGTNSFTDADGKVLSPEKAREKIKEEELKGRALVMARQQANRFASALLDLEKPSVADFLALAATNQLTVKVTEPFRISEVPKDLDVPLEFSRAVHEMTEQNPVSARPVIGKEAVHVYALKGFLNPEDPPLDSIREQVTEDYRKFEAGNLMRKAAEEFHKTLTNGLASGKSFAEIAKAGGLEPVSFGPIARGARGSEEVEKHTRFFMFQSAAWETPVGKTSELVNVGDAAFIVHVTERRPAPVDKMAAALPAQLQELRDNYQSAAVSDWYRRQSQAVQTPVGKEKTETP